MATKIGGKKPDSSNEIKLIELLSNFEELYQKTNKQIFNKELSKFRDEHSKLIFNRHYVSNESYGQDFLRFLVILRAIYALGYTKFKYFNTNVLVDNLKCSLHIFLIMLQSSTYFNTTDSTIKSVMIKPSWYRSEEYRKFMKEIEKIRKEEEEKDYSNYTDRVKYCTAVSAVGLLEDLQKIEQEFYSELCKEKNMNNNHEESDADHMDLCIDDDDTQYNILDDKNHLIAMNLKGAPLSTVGAHLSTVGNVSFLPNGNNIGLAGGESKKKGGKRKLKSYKFN